jgi:hypothetical protein
MPTFMLLDHQIGNLYGHTFQNVGMSDAKYGSDSH